MVACTGFHALLTSNQNVNATAFLLLFINNEVFDEGAFFNTVTFQWTPPAGIVALRGTVSFSVLAGFPPRFGTCAIFKNATEFKKGTVVAVDNSNPRSVVATEDLASGTDTYELRARHNSSVGEQIFSDPRLTYFSGAVLGRPCSAAA